MRTYSLPLIILLLFFSASLLLTLRHEALLHEGDQAFVSVGYTNAHAADDGEFFILQTSDTARTLTIEYRYPTETKTETLTLSPQERRIISPDPVPITITVRYHDTANQEQVLTLYKK